MESDMPAFGKTFVITALNSTGEYAIQMMLNDKLSKGERELIDVMKTNHNPLSIGYHIRDESFKQKIEEVSDQMAKKGKKFGIKNYPVQKQVDILKKNMSVRNCINAIIKNLSKYKASLYDVSIEVL
jgi:hypothetical protein